MLLGACTSQSDKMLDAGDTVLTYTGFPQDDTLVKEAMRASLKERGWTITGETPFTAKIDNRGQHAKLSIAISNGVVNLDTKGSTLDSGKAYVPINYSDLLMKSAYKRLGGTFSRAK